MILDLLVVEANLRLSLVSFLHSSFQGKKPEAFYLVKDPEVREFVEKCLATVTCRLTALELLQDPFLRDDNVDEFDMRPIDYYNGYDETGVFLRQPLIDDPLYHDQYESSQICEIDLFANDDEDHVDISIKGKKNGNDGIFLRLRISDAEGKVSIFFSHSFKIIDHKTVNRFRLL